MIVTESDSSEESSEPARWLAGVLQMCGTGKDIWEGEDADEYVRRLRADWSDRSSSGA
jgi:hypothetical protein